MPQLDKFIYFPQIFWLILGFILVYFLLLKKGLPRLYKILFFRKQQLESYFSRYKYLKIQGYFAKENKKRLVSKLFKSIDNSITCVSTILDAEIKEQTSKKKLNENKSIHLKKNLSMESILQDLETLSNIDKQVYCKTKSELKDKVCSK